jgi:hypothetical protein
MGAGIGNQASMVQQLMILWKMTEDRVPSQSFGVELEETPLSMFQKGVSCYCVLKYQLVYMLCRTPITTKNNQSKLSSL